jgi:uncharacterized protein YoxC
MAQAASKTCEICNRASGGHFCIQCDQLFCEDCKISHLRSKVCRNHTFLSGPNIQQKAKVECTDHKEDFIFFCEECDVLICRVCITKTHKKHDITDIKDSVKELESKIPKYLNSKVDNYRSNTKKIDDGVQGYKAEVEETVKTIREQGKAIKKLVDRKVDFLIKALRDRENIELQSLSQTNTDCKDLLEEGRKQEQIYQDTLQMGDKAASFQKLRKLKSDIDQMKTIEVTRLPSTTYNRKDVKGQDVDMLFGKLNFQ